MSLFRRKTDFENVLGITRRIPPDKWLTMSTEEQLAHIAELEQREAHGRKTLSYYRACCKELGLGRGAMSDFTWMKTTREAQNDHVRQMQKAVGEHREAQRELEDAIERGWGAF
jgi:hypothetical protein